MMRTNLFPAILLAGPPHCGKSVLAFLLTQRLRELGVAHYLLRAAPDGEGDWFLAGKSDLVRTLRLQHKTGYSPQFVDHMRAAIESRLLPLLVDVGGRPQGEQLGILKACTHSILLYRTDDELRQWQELIAGMDLLPIAELRSNLDGDEKVETSHPVLRGSISGLERERQKVGETFGALLDRVAGICRYDASILEQEHLRHAPFPAVNERELALKLDVPSTGAGAKWEPGHLARIGSLVPAAEPCAIYGRGPVWLAAALAVRALPAPCALFDARYGWITVPEVTFRKRGGNIKVQISLMAMDCATTMNKNGCWLEVKLPGGILEPEKVLMPTVMVGTEGIAISGKLPRWLFAALARKFAPERNWIGIDDPKLAQVIIVHSNNPSLRPGNVLLRPGTP